MKTKEMARTIIKFMLTLVVATAPFFARHSAEAHIFLNRYEGDTATIVYHMPGNQGVYYDITYGNCTGIVGKPGDFQLEVRVPLKEVQFQKSTLCRLTHPAGQSQTTNASKHIKWF